MHNLCMHRGIFCLRQGICGYAGRNVTPELPEWQGIMHPKNIQTDLLCAIANLFIENMMIFLQKVLLLVNTLIIMLVYRFTNNVKHGVQMINKDKERKTCLIQRISD